MVYTESLLMAQEPVGEQEVVPGAGGRRERGVLALEFLPLQGGCDVIGWKKLGHWPESTSS